MISYEELSYEESQMNNYKNRALSLMQVFESEQIEKFYVWLNRFEYVADIIRIPRDKKVKFFHEMVNNDVHTRVQQNNASIDFSKLSYDVLSSYYLDDFSTLEVNIHRERFMARNQYEHEPIKHYANCLRKLITKCDYKYGGEKELVDKFFYGLRETVIRNHLSKKVYGFLRMMVEEAVEFAKVNLISNYVDQALFKIDTYNPRNEGIFYAWLNKFEYVAQEINLPYNKMLEFFNKMVDNDVHTSVHNTFPFVNFSEHLYEDVIYFYLFHFSPDEDDLQRQRIHCRKQYEHETIENYANSLRKIFKKCIYTTELEEKLLEQFINGLRENNIRTHLSKYPSLSFDKTVEIVVKFAKVNLATYYRDHALLKINIYNLGDEFHLWLNKFEYVADMIDVPNSKMIEFFIEMIDSDAHQNVMQANPSLDYSKLSYDQIINHYFCHFVVSDDTEKARIFFYFRHQYEQEPLEKYANCLRKKIKMCNYTSNVNSKLYKKFKEGLREDYIRTHLSEFGTLQFDEGVKLAVEIAKVNLVSYYRDHALLKINTFNLGKDDEFHVWLNKFEYVANLLDVPDDKMVKLLNEMVDNNFHTYVKQIYPSVNFSELSYEDTVIHYLRLFFPKESNLRVRLFACRNQYEHEPIKKYANSLRYIFNKCTYTTDNEEILLCEQFINGLRENDIKTHLLANPELSFDQTVMRAVDFAKINLISYYVDRALLKINIYRKEKEDLFHDWLNKFEYVADMINVPNNKMLEFFYKMVDDNLNTSVWNTYPLVDFSQHSYEDIINIYFCFFSYNGIDSHRTRFLSRYQYEHESIEKYANCLEALINKCEYSKYVQKKLSRRFLDGLRKDSRCDHLRKYYLLSFDHIRVVAIELAKVNLISYYVDQAALKIDAYNPRTEGLFYAWLNKFECVANVIDVPNNKMVEFFYKMVNNDVHTSVQMTYPSVNFSELQYDQIIELYYFHFATLREIDINNIRYMSRNQ